MPFPRYDLSFEPTVGKSDRSQMANTKTKQKKLDFAQPRRLMPTGRP
jgi:hypothetical protein